MKAEELMIHDWANNGSANFQITGTQLFDLYMGYMDEPQPIPLTTEVLEANGFVNQTDECLGLLWTLDISGETGYIKAFFPLNGVKIWIIINPRDRERVNNFDLRYVHELQHALRLCGLSDIANNFKIE